jgi:hypothetical protein
VIQDLFVRRRFSLVQDNLTNVNVEACPINFSRYSSFPLLGVGISGLWRFNIDDTGYIQEEFSCVMKLFLLTD